MTLPSGKDQLSTTLLGTLVGIASGVALLLLFAMISAVSPMNGEDYALAMPLDVESTRSTIGWILERSALQRAETFSGKERPKVRWG